MAVARLQRFPYNVVDQICMALWYERGARLTAYFWWFSVRAVHRAGGVPCDGVGQAGRAQPDV
jgi:hypothetical protein